MAEVQQTKKKKKEIPEDIQLLLKTVVDHFDKDDRTVREAQIRGWRQLKYLWEGYNRIWYSETAHDWRVYTETKPDDAEYYDKIVNVFRAYLESIIAALSINIPSIRCAPDDADNPLDLSTAKAGDKIADLVYKHNNVMLLWLRTLYLYCTEGMVACYNYTKEDYSYGSYSENKYEDVEEEQTVSTCPNCGNEIPEQLKNLLEDEYDPDDYDVDIQDILESGDFCPTCFDVVQPQIEQKKVIVNRLTGVTTKPKSRQCLEVYGGLYVKVPNYACRQEDIPCLTYKYETHYSNAYERFPHLIDKSNKQIKFGTTSADYSYERWGRLPLQYAGEYPQNNVTVNNTWLRASSFNVLQDKDKIDKLKKEFPNGARVVLINDIFCEAENEALDDHWTLTINPLSDYIHFDPLGVLLISVQEITNDLISLTLQTIEHGIPQTFADPGVLNFNAYDQSEVRPGDIFPAKPQSGRALTDAFHEVKTATLSPEVMPFAQKVQEMGQLVSGALPSLFGGAQSGSSRTAAQYSMSRSQALQRLQTPWKMFTLWWKDIFGKVIPAYIKDAKEYDDKFVTKDQMGNYVNTFIRRAELEGKIGEVELEASEQLPLSWGQRKDVLMQLMQGNNPMIMQALSMPENARIVTEIIGFDDIVLPGANEREKQLEEIKALLQSAPLDEQTPSVPVDPMVDKHPIESEICYAWLVSDAGRLNKIENPEGYQNVVLHKQQHDMIIQQQMMTQIPEEQPQNNKVIPMAARLPKGASNAPSA